MSHRSRFGILLIVLFAAAGAWPAGQIPQSAPSAPPGQRPALTGTGFIAGQVVEAATGRPIAEAQVTALARTVPGGRGVGVPAILADAQGRFFFRNLAPGSYVVTATRTGFGPVRGALVDIADGERVLDTRIRLAKFGAISGALRDTAGEPVVGTEIVAFQRSYATGRLVLQAVTRGVKSDDRGMYRIPGVPPGEYLVCACLRDPIPFDQLLLTTLAAEPFNLMSLAARALASGSDAVALDDTLRGFAPTFHPASRSMAQAARVTVSAGEERTSVDITAEFVRATRVSGRIVGAQSPMQAGSLRLVPLADADAGLQLTAIQPMLVQADGRFDFANVPPGQYRLIVTHRETGGRGGGPSGLALNFTGGRGMSPPSAPIAVAGPGVAPPPVLWANDVITVGDRGLAGLVVTLSEALTVSGRVQFVGSAPQPTEQLLQRSSLALPQTAAAGGPSVSAFGPVTATGTFKAVGAVPGKYAVSFTGVPGYTTLKSITLAGLEVLDLPIEIGTKDPGELVLTYVDTPAASITVTVPPQPGRRSDEDVILLFPADRKYWPDPSAGRRRFRTQQVSSKGVATLSDLPAGDYFIVLETDFVIADWQESTLETLSRRAQRLTLNDGEKKAIEVRR